ncbi:hypothetical protein NKI72_22065 [Mesorhizobium sp. M0437]|uniref:hypothetical protein n=1 Tax=Mesorhizobium sp. M0437 TaxID=2956945 RepID=UPI00333B2E01
MFFTAEPGPRCVFEEIRVESEGIDGLLAVPDGALGIVILAHGGDSGRFSPRNNVAAA